MSRRILILAMVALILIPVLDVSAASVALVDDVSYNENIDYLQIMSECAARGDDYSLALGEICERQRNAKIEGLNLEHAQTNYFTSYDAGEDILRAIKIDRLKLEHEVAGAVYEHLSLRGGYSDIVIAGILGNMMAECGGQTLDLQWWLYGGGGRYYGLCMWSLYYGPEVNGLGIDGQMEYLLGNIKDNMEQFGGSHTYFCEIQDAGAAARYFCSYYERGSGSGVRARNAYRAYSWITA